MRNRIVVFAVLLIASTSQSFGGVNRWTSSGPEGASIASLAADGSGVLYAGTTGGIFRSTSTGDPDWQPFNTGLTDITTTALAVDGDVVLAGTATGRLFRSVKGGPWTEAARLEGGVVYQFAVDRQRDTIYAAAGSAGLVRSRDGGLTWEVVPVRTATSWASDVILTGDGTLYALLSSQLFVSIDGGVTWTSNSKGFSSSIAADAESTIYTIDNGLVAFSTDYGKTWQFLSGLGRSANRLFPRAGGVYAGTSTGLYAFDIKTAGWTRLDHRHGVIAREDRCR
jgi:photosystem II stability/assembly factor-like uncharacterized protein